MKVLLIGSGGREHALAAALNRDTTLEELHVAPGNPGIAEIALCHAIDITDNNAIVELAMNPPTNKREFDKVLRPIGLRPRWKENLDTWLAAIASAVALPESEFPEMRAAGDSMPPTKIWKERFPEKYAPFTHARAAVEKRAAELNIPVENLISPEVIRKLVWKLSPDVAKDALELGARPWQIAEIADLVSAALLEREPLAQPEAPEATESE